MAQEHNAEIKRVMTGSGGAAAAVCSCGWQGPPWHGLQEAQRDVDYHIWATTTQGAHVTKFNENLVLIPHTDNVWVDPSIIVSIAKQRIDGITPWYVVFQTGPVTRVGEKPHITVYFETSELADEAIAAVAPPR